MTRRTPPLVTTAGPFTGAAACSGAGGGPAAGPGGSRRVRRSRRTAAAGAAMVLVGALVLGHLAWQLWGTTVVAERRHERAVGELESAWEEGSDTADLSFGTAEAIVRIPRFGDAYAVPVLAGTGPDVLASGLGHFDGSAAPGEVGNYALAGHRITHGEPLRAMPDLRVGDEVVVETRTAVHTYELVTAGDELEVAFTDTWVLASSPVPPDPGDPAPPRLPDARLLTLTTCAELFHTDGRLVAFGVLTGTQRR